MSAGGHFSTLPVDNFFLDFVAMPQGRITSFRTIQKNEIPVSRERIRRYSAMNLNFDFAESL